MSETPTGQYDIAELAPALDECYEVYSRAEYAPFMREHVQVPSEQLRLDHDELTPERIAELKAKAKVATRTFADRFGIKEDEIYGLHRAVNAILLAEMWGDPNTVRITDIMGEAPGELIRGVLLVTRLTGRRYRVVAHGGTPVEVDPDRPPVETINRFMDTIDDGLALSLPVPPAEEQVESDSDKQ